ncbi:MAG: hypothetical protein LBG80_09210 [Bacteroidales bacterium]|jgi:hypothetical protein|nr:hypothetical protein [Bacteroidales bacterium]
MKGRVDKWTSEQGKGKICFAPCSEINAGIACSDRANEDDMSLKRWNNPLILTCHPYGILLTANIFSTDMSSLRDFLSATPENTDIAITSALSKSRRDDTLLTVCFSLRGIACSDRANEVEPRPNEATWGSATWQSLPLTVIASRAATWQPKRSGARRSQSVPKDALIVTDCFAEPVPNKVWRLAMTALFRRLRASAHFQFSIFNFQFSIRSSGGSRKSATKE